jgi:hypothetical protein
MKVSSGHKLVMEYNCLVGNCWYNERTACCGKKPEKELHWMRSGEIRKGKKKEAGSSPYSSIPLSIPAVDLFVPSSSYGVVWYIVSLPEGGNLSVSVLSSIALYSVDGALINSDDDFIESGLSIGDYVVAIGSYNTVFQSGFRISVSGGPIEENVTMNVTVSFGG